MSLARRKGRARRTRAPLPLPARDGSPTVAVLDEGAPVAFGPQAELCRSTMCAACWATEQRAHRRPVDWTRLPAAETGRRSVAHHEPARGTAVATTDKHCLPLCPEHHDRINGGLCFAHRHPDFNHNPDAFYLSVNVYQWVDGKRLPDWRAVIAEMQRRTKSLTAIPADEGEAGASLAMQANR